MAEMDTSGGGGHKKGPGVKKSKKQSTKVDLTPMVDLGFLLITFFVFTTTASEPREIQLLMPAGQMATTPVGDSKVLTIIPLSGDSILYYHGDLQKASQNGLYGITNFSITKGI